MRYKARFKQLIICFLLLNAIYIKAQRLNLLIDSLQKELTTCKADSSKIKILDALSYSISKVDPDKGLMYANLLKDFSQATKDNKGLAAAYSNLGLNYSAKYDYELAANNYMEAINLYNKLGNKKAEASVFSNMSLLHLNKSDYTNALEYAFKALKVFEGMHAYRNTAIVQENIGTIFLEQKKFEKTLSYYSLAYENFNKISDLESMARVLGNKGIVLNERGNYSEALICHTLALKTNQLRGNKKSEQINLANIAITYLNQKKYEKALDYNLKALKISQELNDKKGTGINLGNTGEVYLTIAKQTHNPGSRAENLTKSISFLKSAKEICTETNFVGPLIEFSKNLSEAYALAGMPELPLNEFKKYTSVKDSLNNSETQVKIASLESKREIDLKNKELEMKEKQMQISILEIKNKRSKMIILIIAITLLLSVVLLMYVFIRLRSLKHKKILSEIAYLQSHEVRAPLARILGLINVIDYVKHDSNDNKKVLLNIQKSAQELDEVIKKIVDKTYKDLKNNKT